MLLRYALVVTKLKAISSAKAITSELAQGIFVWSNDYMLYADGILILAAIDLMLETWKMDGNCDGKCDDHGCAVVAFWQAAQE